MGRIEYYYMVNGKKLNAWKFEETGMKLPVQDMNFYQSLRNFVGIHTEDNKHSELILEVKTNTFQIIFNKTIENKTV